MVLLSIHDTILCFRNFQQSQCSLNTLYPFVLDFFLFVLDFFHVFFETVVFLFTKENYLILFIRHQKNLSNSTELITEFLSFTRFFFGFSGFYFQDRRWQLIVSCSWLDLNYIINDTLLVILDAWFVRWDNRRTYFAAWQLHLPTKLPKLITDVFTFIEIRVIFFSRFNSTFPKIVQRNN